MKRGMPARRSPRHGSDAIARLRTEVAKLRAEVRALRSRDNGGSSHPAQCAQAVALPELPPPDSKGHYPATETLGKILARQLIQRRHAAKWTQAELAARAGVRQETLSRLESGKHAPTVTTVDKLDRALKQAGV